MATTAATATIISNDPDIPAPQRAITDPRAFACEMIARNMRGTHWVAGGRGDNVTGFDQWGFVRRCVAAGRAVSPHDLPDLPAGYSAASSGHPDMVTHATAVALLRSWGLVDINPRYAGPGDLLLFATPAAHPAVLMRSNTGHAVIMHTFDGRGRVGADPLQGRWTRQLVGAFAWSAGPC